MSEQITKILEMVKDGIISVEEGNELIMAVKTVEEKAVKTNGKTLFIKVDSSDGDKVNVKLPLNIAKVFLKSGNMKFGNVNLNDYNIDVESLGELLDKDLVGDLVEVKSADGDFVHIYVQ